MQVVISRTILALMTTGAVSCASEHSSPGGYRGEAFCIVGKAPSAVSRERPVEDFVLHRLSYSGRQFTVYEGNHPKSEGWRTAPIQIGSSLKATSLSRLGAVGVRVETLGSEWPKFIQITTKESAEAQQELLRLLSRLRLRTGSTATCP